MDRQNHVDDLEPTSMSFKMGRAAARPPKPPWELGRHHIDFTKANCHSSTHSVSPCVCDPDLTMLHAHPGLDIDSPHPTLPSLPHSTPTLHRKSSLRSFPRPILYADIRPVGVSPQPHCVTQPDLVFSIDTVDGDAAASSAGKSTVFYPSAAHGAVSRCKSGPPHAHQLVHVPTSRHGPGYVIL